MVADQVCRAVCVDGPALGAQITTREATEVLVHHPQAGVLLYELAGELSSFPGGLRAARFVRELGEHDSLP